MYSVETILSALSALKDNYKTEYYNAISSLIESDDLYMDDSGFAYIIKDADYENYFELSTYEASIYRALCIDVNIDNFFTTNLVVSGDSCEDFDDYIDFLKKYTLEPEDKIKTLESHYKKCNFEDFQYELNYILEKIIKYFYSNVSPKNSTDLLKDFEAKYF